MISLIRLRSKIESSWSIDTTYCPETYLGKHPSYGQCKATTALIAAVFYNWKPYMRFYKGQVEDREHVWLTIHGIVVDWTWQQFKPGAIVSHVKEIDEKDLCANLWEFERFRNLKVIAVL